MVESVLHCTIASKAAVAGVSSRLPDVDCDINFLAQGQNDAAQQYFQQAFDLQFKTQAPQLSAGKLPST
jgi:hypothetical protein